MLAQRVNRELREEEGIYATVDSMWKTSRSGFIVGFLQKRQNTKGVHEWSIAMSNVQKTKCDTALLGYDDDNDVE